MARLSVREERAQDAAGILARLAERSRQEPGCLNYEVFRDRGDRSRFASFERWASRTEESAHWNADAIKEAMSDLEAILDGAVEVSKYEPAGSEV